MPTPTHNRHTRERARQTSARARERSAQLARVYEPGETRPVHTDEQGRRYVWVFLWSDQPLYYGGKWFNYAADVYDKARREVPWEMMDRSLGELLATHHPGVLLEHKRDGTAHGYVDAHRTLTREEAAELGIEQRDDRAVYVRVIVSTAHLLGMLERGEALFTSPHALVGDVDDDKRELPASFAELSFTSDPHQRARQPKVPDVQHAQLRRPAMDDNTTEEMPAWAKKLMEMTAEQGRRIEALEAGTESAAQLAGDDDDDAGAGAGDGDGAGDDDKASAKMSRENAALLARMERIEKEAAADRAKLRAAECSAELSGYVLTDKEQALLQRLYVSDGEAYEMMLGRAERKSAPTGGFPFRTPSTNEQAQDGPQLRCLGMPAEAASLSRTIDADADALLRHAAAKGETLTTADALKRVTAAWQESIAQ